MSTRLEVDASIAAGVSRVWTELVDWEGQHRWIPFTTVAVEGGRRAGLGTRVTALSGFRLAGLPVGLLDRFVVTGWTPPTARPDGSLLAELEVLHLGPYFTGEGVFTLTGDETRTSVRAVELFSVPGGAVTNRPLGLLLPTMRAGFGHALHRLAGVAGAR